MKPQGGKKHHVIPTEREKEGIKEFIEHWWVYIKEKYFQGGWLYGKIKGI